MNATGKLLIDQLGLNGAADQAKKLTDEEFLPWFHAHEAKRAFEPHPSPPREHRAGRGFRRDVWRVRREENLV